MALRCMSHGTHMNKAWRTYMNESWYTLYICVPCLIVSHGTHVNDSWHSCEWVIANESRHIMHVCVPCLIHVSSYVCHDSLSHGIHTSESWHIYEWFVALMWMRHSTQSNESWHTCGWVMVHTWTSHVTRILIFPFFPPFLLIWAETIVSSGTDTQICIRTLTHTNMHTHAQSSRLSILSLASFSGKQRTHLSVYMTRHVWRSVHEHKHAHTHIHTQTYTYTHTHTYIHSLTCNLIYIYVYVYVYVCVPVHDTPEEMQENVSHTYAQTHTHMLCSFSLHFSCICICVYLCTWHARRNARKYLSHAHTNTHTHALFVFPPLFQSNTILCILWFNWRAQAGMGWLRLVGSLKLQVSFAENRLFYRALLQKRPIILRSLLIVATP